jgi:hypothetical protein
LYEVRVVCGAKQNDNVNESDEEAKKRPRKGLVGKVILIDFQLRHFQLRHFQLTSERVLIRLSLFFAFYVC